MSLARTYWRTGVHIDRPQLRVRLLLGATLVAAADIVLLDLFVV
jgi:hypothetical protein